MPETLVVQEKRHLLTSYPVVADDYRLPLPVELPQATHDLAHGYELGALDPADGKLPGFANIQ
jgi:hypothetical protein